MRHKPPIQEISGLSGSIKIKRATNNPMLKYLFTAKFEDGSEIIQTSEDKSVIDPIKRNTYYDLVQAQKTKKLVSFRLKEAIGERWFSVDLLDGHFEVNGIPFYMHEVENKEVHPIEITNPLQLKDFELVYFQSNTHTFRAAVQDGRILKAKEMGSQIKVFRFGWRTQHNGKNYQQIIQIS